MRAIAHWFNSYLLIELGKGLSLTLRYLFGSKVTLLYPEQKRLSRPAFAVFMHCAVTPTGRNVVSLANSAKRCVQRLQ